MPENFQTSWNRNKGNADWYSQLLSALNDSEVKIKYTKEHQKTIFSH